MMAGYLLCAVLGGVVGYVVAHSVIARECERLGGFYVGNTVYECKAKGER